MENYMMINGKKIEVSKETADNLEREFGNKTPKNFDITVHKEISELRFNGIWRVGVNFQKDDWGKSWEGSKITNSYASLFLHGDWYTQEGVRVKGYLYYKERN